MASRVPAEQPAPLPETRRADAERNVQRIHEAAIRLWADEPNAGVADVAAAAGGESPRRPDFWLQCNHKAGQWKERSHGLRAKRTAL
jgi:hypothetical protein